MDQQGDEFEISVEVSDPKIKDGINKYTVYTVRGMDRNGQFDVVRRYNDFQLIRVTLISKWPGCYIPPLPQKKPFGNMEQQFIDERMLQLQDFLKKIANAKYLWYSEEFQVFVKQSGDIEKALSQIPKVTNDEIINKYQDTFTELSGKEINRELIQKIADFNSFLKKVSPMVDNFKQIAKNIANARGAYQQSVVTLITSFLPDYEQNIMQEYTEQQDKLIISNIKNSEQMQDLFNNYKTLLQQNEFQQLYQEVRKESKELKAFMETFEQRDKYEQQKVQAEQKQKELQIELQEVLAGKTTLKSIFVKTKKEDIILKLQQQIDATNKDIENIQFICDILTVLLGYVEIDRFKIEKQAMYYKMMKGIIEYEIRLNQMTQEFWEKVTENYYLI